MNEPYPATNSIYLDSSRAQHQRILDQSAVVLKLGLLLMKSGASAYRVKTSMARLAKAVGLEEHHAQISFTEISTTAYSATNFRTEVAETRTKGVNVYRIDQLGKFVSSLPERIEPAVAAATLTRIEKSKPLYAPWLLALAAGVACAAFSFLNRGGALECAVVLLAAAGGQLLRSTLAHRGMNHMAVWTLCGLFSASSYVLIMQALAGLGAISDNHMVGFISAILYLVPGFPLVTGMLEIARMDFSSGIARLTYTTLLLLSVSCSVWLVSVLFGLPLETAPPQNLDPSLLWALRLLASFIAAFGFAMLFSASYLVCLWAGFIAALINPARLWLVETYDWAPHLAIMAAAMGAGVLSELITPFYGRRFSRVSLSVPAAVTMIPGVPFYLAMAHFSNGQVTEALSTSVQVVLIFLALGMGMAFARLLMDREWLYDRDIQKLSALPEKHMR